MRRRNAIVGSVLVLGSFLWGNSVDGWSVSTGPLSASCSSFTTSSTAPTAKECVAAAARSGSVLAKRSCWEMKINPSGRSSSSSKSWRAGASSLVTRNNRRKAQAGRVGTKRFVDPCKVFVGNLPYSATKEDLQAFLQSQLGTLASVYSIKLVRDWKTGLSKGYAFVDFCEVMAATSAMETLHGTQWQGRVLNFHQGRRKRPDPVVYVTHKDAPPRNDEEAAIQEGLRQATNEPEQGQSEQEEDAWESQSLAVVKNHIEKMKKEAEEQQEENQMVEFQFNPMEYANYYSDEEEEDEDDDKDEDEENTPMTPRPAMESESWDCLEPLELQDEELRNFDFQDLDDNDNDDDKDVDGVFEEVWSSLLQQESEAAEGGPLSNRQRRREAARRVAKQKKLPYKGFQPLVSQQ